MVMTSNMYELRGLSGDLEQYNGIATRCMHLANKNGDPNPMWHVRISEKLTLELPRRFLRPLSEFDFPVVAEDAWQIIMQNEEKQANKLATGYLYVSNNRKDVRRTMDSLLVQLRNVLVRRGGSNVQGRCKHKMDIAIQQLFLEMDSNHNGELDKKEFFDGCTQLGIAMSTAEINLIWPGKVLCGRHGCLLVAV